MKRYTHNAPLQWCIEQAKRTGQILSFYGRVKEGMRKSIEQHLGNLPGCRFTQGVGCRTYTITSGSAALCVVSDDRGKLYLKLSDWNLR